MSTETLQAGEKAIEFIIWLALAEPLRSQMHSIVQQLSKTYDAPEFEPHVTVYIGSGAEDAARAAASLVPAEFAHIELYPEKLDSTVTAIRLRAKPAF